MGLKMLSDFMITGLRRALYCLALLAAISCVGIVGCERVPLLAPAGSTITLVSSTTTLALNSTTTLTAQLLEPAGTAPHSGTTVTVYDDAWNGCTGGSRDGHQRTRHRPVHLGLRFWGRNDRGEFWRRGGRGRQRREDCHRGSGGRSDYARGQSGQRTGHWRKHDDHGERCGHGRKRVGRGPRQFCERLRHHLAGGRHIGRGRQGADDADHDVDLKGYGDGRLRDAATAPRRLPRRPPR